MPPSVLLSEIAWRSARAAVQLASRARDEVLGPRPPTSLGTFSPFLLQGREKPRLEALHQASVASCLGEAEAALAGRFQILGHGGVEFGIPPRWHDDPLADFSWGAGHHSAMSPAPGQADIKVAWEASRLQWLVALARARAFSGEERFALGANRLLEDWRDANPPGWGPNWANAMEAGIRVVNLLWAAEIMGDPALDRTVSSLLPAHGQFIVENLEYSPRLTSNHYLADVVGLLYAGGALRRTRRGRAWTRFAIASLQREVLKQFRSDGMNFEASTGYHRLSTELVLFGLIAAQRLGLAVRNEVWERFASALDALRMLTKPDGSLPAIGDDDSGLVAGLSSGRSPRDPAPILGAGAVLLGAPAKPEAGGEFELWAVGGTASVEPVRRGGALRSSGFYLLSSDDLWCLIDCGDVGQRGNGGHAHNDTLSFVLCVGGQELVTDPGTFTYTRDPEARNWFRSTAAHASVQVDGEEINRLGARGSLFKMTSDDRPTVEEFDLSPECQRLVATHAGYGRLRDPVLHRRSWALAADGLIVSDEMCAQGAHRVVFTLPLAIGVTTSETDNGVWLLQAKDVVVSMRQCRGKALALRPVPHAVSSQYGHQQPSVALRAEQEIQGTTRWSFAFARHGGIW